MADIWIYIATKVHWYYMMYKYIQQDRAPGMSTVYLGNLVQFRFPTCSLF